MAMSHVIALNLPYAVFFPALLFFPMKKKCFEASILVWLRRRKSSPYLSVLGHTRGGERGLRPAVS